MTTQCVNLAKVLDSVVRSYSTDLLLSEKLPIDVNENSTADLKPGLSNISLEDDLMFAPHSILACDAAVTHMEARVRAGTPAATRCF